MPLKKRKYESVRQQNRQSAILTCAREMLEELGYAGLTMRSLAKRASVAPATLYNLYGSKDDLVVAAVDDLLTDLGQRAQGVDVAPGIDALLAMTRLTAEQVQATPKYADAMARALFSAERGGPLVEVLFARGYPFHVQHLAIAQQQGHVRPEVNPEIVAKHLIGDGWGQIMLWMMGMFSLAETGKEQVRSQLITLISITRGTSRRRLEKLLEELGWERGDGSAEGGELAEKI